MEPRAVSKIREPYVNTVDRFTIWRDIDGDGVIMRIRTGDDHTRLRLSRANATVLADAIRDALEELPA
jgi:hypothetical protein